MEPKSSLTNSFVPFSSPYWDLSIEAAVKRDLTKSRHHQSTASLDTTSVPALPGLGTSAVVTMIVASRFPEIDTRDFRKSFCDPQGPVAQIHCGARPSGTERHATGKPLRTARLLPFPQRREPFGGSAPLTMQRSGAQDTGIGKCRNSRSSI